ncbi:MAG: FAD-dependent oxidoreductase [Candidatus Omnitrophica bacterium]|nr:FAD-dependent oxidoreductase [Candidatus Omnitrophota bacterium]
MRDDRKVYDLLIIGAGPAGITAGIYAARKKMEILVIAGEIGGQTAWSGDIENYVGYQFITGLELTDKFQEHMRKYGINVLENTYISEIRKENNIVKINAGEFSFSAKTAILATGKRSRPLNVPGEVEFRNKGVAYCATCDAPIFAGKDVAVIGGGNSALEAALQLIKIANKIYIINLGPDLHGDEIIREKVVAAKNVVIMNETKVKEIKGGKLVDSIVVENGSDSARLSVQGVFVEIGLIPNTEFKSDIVKNEQGEIIITRYNETNITGIFAAGDVTDTPEKQIIIAAGEGAKAALSAFKYLARQ